MMLNNFPKEVIDYFNIVKQEALQKGNSESTSELIALESVKSKLVVKDGLLVANSDVFKIPTVYTFNLTDANTKIILNANSDEEIVMEAILASTEPNVEGYYFTEEELEDLMRQIDEGGSTLPDIDHAELKALVKQFGRNDELIKSELAKRKGVFKNIKSVVKDGKLWIQAFLDKRYKNHVNKFTSLSIESFADVDVGSKRLRNPKYLGFTFTNNPQLKSAKIR